MVDIESMTIVENLSSCFLDTIIMLAIPSKTSNNEKKILIARTAITSSVAVLSIYEYQFQMTGTKKCHIPKPIEIMLPKVVSIFIKVFFKVYYVLLV
jgi:NAD/NADP transhydrogenase alpha subunit